MPVASAPIRLALLAACLLGGCGRATPLATTDPSGADASPQAAFLALDANGDGALARSESGLPGFYFDQLDADANGGLSYVEWSAGHEGGDTAYRTQLLREQTRDVASEPHRNGSTVRGTN